MIKSSTLLLLLWFAAIIVMTLIPITDTPSTNEGFIDKVAHFLQFFVLSLLYYRVKKVRGSEYRLIIKHIVLIGIPLSITIESLQLFVSYRNFSIYDIIANYSGFIIASLIIAIIHSKFFSKQSQSSDS